MADWRYRADGGVYTVSEGELRELVVGGRLDGYAEVQEVGSDRWMSVAASPFGDLLRHAPPKSAPIIGPGLRRVIVLALVAAAAYGAWWYGNRLTCSGSDVKRIAAKLVREKLLMLTTGDVDLVNIATLGRLDSGGVQCSADVEITGGASGTRYGAVAYSAERKGDTISVIGHMER